MLFAVALICGCTPNKNADPRDAEIAQLQATVKNLESKVANLTTQTELNTSNFVTGSQGVLSCISNLTVIYEFQSVISKRLEKHIADQTIHRTNPPAATAGTSTRSATKTGPVKRNVLTDSVLAEIKRKAQLEWPGDYSMQAYEIKKQTEAFQRMTP